MWGEKRATQCIKSSLCHSVFNRHVTKLDELNNLFYGHATQEDGMVLSQVQKQWHCLLKVWITVHIMLQCVSFRALGWISRSWICEAFWFEFGRFAKLHYCWHRLFEASYFPKFGIPVNVLYFGVTPDFLVHLSLLQEQSQVGIIFRKTAQVSLKHFLVHKSKLKGPLYPVISTVWGNS